MSLSTRSWIAASSRIQSACNSELERRVAERTEELQASAARLRENEERLRDAGRRKDEFLATLAHELRNPLAPIRTAVQLLRRNDLTEANLTKSRDIIERQVDHMVRLIDDLMDVSRIPAGSSLFRKS
jgi:signal transduction histidine kinase